MTSNQFAAALKSRALKSRAPAPEPPAPARSASPAGGSAKRRHVGGYFSPAVAKQLRLLACEEETTLQELLGEALTLLFAKRGLPLP